MALQIITPPTAEPVTLDEVKARLRITSTADDSLITSLIPTARRFAERVTRKSLVAKGYVLSLDRFPHIREPLRFPVGLVSAVGAIAYLDETGTAQTWDSSEYLVGLAQLPAVLVPVAPNIYPATLHAPGFGSVVTIPFTAGPAPTALQVDISENLEGIRQLVIHFYEHPSAVTAENLKEMPLGIQTLLGADKVYVF